MAFWYLDKTNNKAKIFGSLKALSDYTKINLDSLYYHFSREKKKEWQNSRFRIVKTEIIRGGK